MGHSSMLIPYSSTPIKQPGIHTRSLSKHLRNESGPKESKRPRGCPQGSPELNAHLVGKASRRQPEGQRWCPAFLSSVQASMSRPGSWNTDCFLKLSRAHLGHVVELS